MVGNPKDIYNLYKTNMVNADKSIKKIERERDEPTRVATVPVRVKSNHKDDWVKDLRITLKVNKTSATKQDIDIQITDDADPLVLYLVKIGDQEFHALKQEQSLLIDFQQFPQKFFEMLDFCNSDDKLDDNMSQRSSVSTYRCVLHQINVQDALLIVQEATQFRELNHLILKVKAATERVLNEYLSDVVKEYKARNENYHEETMRLNNILDKTAIELKAVREEMTIINNKQYKFNF